MKTALATYRLKIESPWDILVHKMNKIIIGKDKADKKKWLKHSNQLKRKYFKDGIWNFNGILLPEYKPEPIGWLIYSIYMDSLFVYCKHNDNYSDLLIDKLDEYLPEGTYGYINEEINVTVKENDVVIDAGAWIGDFSAYASIKGAHVYAFEPSKETLNYLRQTQIMNKNINIVEMGLGIQKGTFLLSNNSSNSGANRITTDGTNSEKIELTTIDEFVFQYKLDKVDFIKADIEGFERNMLAGARDTLKRFGPKLAICTYHLQDDPEVLAKIILDANPNYIIVQKRKKLYAMVKNKSY